jgi:hypothetical protein
MKNVDVEMYIVQLMNEAGEEILETLETESGCERETCEEYLIENLQIVCESNIVEFGKPTLTEQQLYKILTTTTTDLVLGGLVETGLVQADFDVEKGENVYTLTEKGKQLGSKLN